MVHINALTLIENFVENNNVRPMKNWALRNSNVRSPRYKFYKDLKAKVIRLLNLISGDNKIAMLKSK